MSITEPNETWKQFYERISANRKKRIAECTDPEDKALLKQIDKDWENDFRVEQSRRKALAPHLLDEMSYSERCEKHGTPRIVGGRHYRNSNDEHRTNEVNHGRAW